MADTRDQNSNYTDNIAFAIKKKYQTLMDEIARSAMPTEEKFGKAVGRDAENDWGAFQYQVGRQSNTQNVAVFGSSSPLVVQ
tara:strand:+ start:20972 stop:21217 length:246 start_codon:yes stop_codon:yes gene_type:complete